MKVDNHTKVLEGIIRENLLNLTKEKKDKGLENISNKILSMKKKIIKRIGQVELSFRKVCPTLTPLIDEKDKFYKSQDVSLIESKAISRSKYDNKIGSKTTKDSLIISPSLKHLQLQYDYIIV